MTIANPHPETAFSQFRAHDLNPKTLLALLFAAVERAVIAAPLMLFVGLLIHTSNKDRSRKVHLERDILAGDYPYHAPALDWGAEGDSQGMYLATLRVSIIQLELAKRALEAENTKKNGVGGWKSTLLEPGTTAVEHPAQSHCRM